MICMLGAAAAGWLWLSEPVVVGMRNGSSVSEASLDLDGACKVQANTHMFEGGAIQLKTTSGESKL